MFGSFIFCFEKIKVEISLLVRLGVISSVGAILDYTCGVDHQRSSSSRAILELHRCAATSSYFIIDTSDHRRWPSSSSTIIAIAGHRWPLLPRPRARIVSAAHHVGTWSSFFTTGYCVHRVSSAFQFNNSSRSVGTRVYLTV